MFVATMLERKGRDIITVSAQSTLSQAISVLTERGIGAVVVLDDDGSLAGILSERDIIQRLAKHGADAMEMKVDDCMTRNVITCREDDSVNGIMTMMNNGRFRHMPVVDKDNKMVGLISVGDVVKNRMEEVMRDTEDMKRYIVEGHF